MNPNDPQNNDQLGKPSTPEEDVALQAIEALDVEGAPSPSDTPPATPVVSNPISDIKSMPPTDPAASPAPVTPAAQNPSPTPAPDLSTQEPAAPPAFQPFANQKKASHPIVTVLVIVLVLALLAAGGYFGWQYYQSTL